MPPFINPPPHPPPLPLQYITIRVKITRAPNSFTYCSWIKMQFILPNACIEQCIHCEFRMNVLEFTYKTYMYPLSSYSEITMGRGAISNQRLNQTTFKTTLKTAQNVHAYDAMHSIAASARTVLTPSSPYTKIPKIRTQWGLPGFCRAWINCDLLFSKWSGGGGRIFGGWWDAKLAVTPSLAHTFVLHILCKIWCSLAIVGGAQYCTRV